MTIPIADLEADDRGPLVFRTITALTALSTIIVLLRFWVGLLYYHGIGLGKDAWALLIAVVFNWGQYALFASAVKDGGVGKHMDVVRPLQDTYANWLIYRYAYDIVYVTVIATIKCGVLIMYYRVLRTHLMKWFTSSLGVAIALWWLALLLVSTLRCTPVRSAFDPFNDDPQCITRDSVNLSNGVPNIISDAWIIGLPLFEIRKLNMTQLQKFGLGGVLLLGVLTVASSILRLIAAVNLYDDDDPTYNAASLFIWTSAECNLAIIAASLPQLRPVLTCGLRVFSLTGGESADSLDASSKLKATGPGAFANASRAQRKMKGIGRRSPEMEGSFQRLDDGQEATQENTTLALWPAGYGSGRKTTVVGKETASIMSQEIPLRSIAVKHELDWRESTGTKLAAEWDALRKETFELEWDRTKEPRHELV